MLKGARLMNDFIETSIKRHEKMAQDRKLAAIELVRACNYKAAIIALTEVIAYKELADEQRLMLEVAEVNGND